MSWGLYSAFVLAAVLLIVMPGPTAMLVSSTSLRHGVRAGLRAVAGSTCAVAVQLAIVVAGVASLLTLLGASFEWIRWIGVAYLVYLGLRTCLGGISAGPEQPPEARAAMRDFARGFVVTLTNPKTLLFLGALLPQFVDPAKPELVQMLVLAATFLVIAGTLDSGWALLAARVGNTLRSVRARRLADLVSGSLLIGTGAALAIVRRSH